MTGGLHPVLPKRHSYITQVRSKYARGMLEVVGMRVRKPFLPEHQMLSRLGHAGNPTVTLVTLRRL